MKKVKLGEVCEVFSGYAFKNFNEEKKGIPVIKIGNILSNGEIETHECSFTEETPQKKYYSCKNDIYIALSGATTGKVGLMKYEDFLINQRVGVVRLKDKKIPINYIYSFLQSKTLKILEDALGAAQPNISPKDILDYEIYVGENCEMQDIADRLDKVSSLIEKRKEQLSKFDQLIKSRFIEMFGTIHDNKFGYKIKTLQDVCEQIKDGTHQTPTYTDDSVNGYKFLSSKDVTTGKIDWEHLKYIPKELHNELYSRIAPRKGDILLAKNGTTGIAAIVDREEIFDIYVSLALLRPLEISSVYLWAAINSVETKQQFDASLKGIGVPNLHLGEIKKAKIIVPPTDEQKQFAVFVERVYKSKLAIQKSIKKLETLKKSLMQQYFG